MSKASHNSIFDEAVWDTTPIIRMTCAELIGYCAYIRGIKKHVYPSKVAQELRRQGLATIYGQIDRNGNEITAANKYQAIAFLNAIHGGSMLLQSVPDPDISHTDIDRLSEEYRLDERDGEFWVIAYALSKQCQDIVVLIDDVDALNEVHREHLREARRFTIYTSLHIIRLLMEKEQVITHTMGITLFVKLQEAWFGTLSDGAKESLLLDEITTRITSKSFKKRFRPEVTKVRPLFGRHSANEDPHWYYPQDHAK